MVQSLSYTKQENRSAGNNMNNDFVAQPPTLELGVGVESHIM